jgi:rhodanese-related sulfurtransferase
MDGTTVERVDVAKAKERVESPDWLVIDLRAPFDYAGGRVPGSVSLPARAIEGSWRKIPAGRKLLFVDDDGSDVDVVCALARALGFADVAALAGGFEAWLDAGYPTETLSDGLRPLDDL